jgi:hypothetical protein
MAARTHKQHLKAPYRPMYGDGASLHLYAGSNQDMISLSYDWNPIPSPAQMDDLFLEIRCTFMTDLYDQSNECEKESESV